MRLNNIYSTMSSTELEPDLSKTDELDLIAIELFKR